MRKGVIVLVLLVLAVQSPQRVEAGAFATEVTQLLNHAQLVMEYIRQGEQLANELNMYADMVRNSRTLSGQTFGAVMNDINALANIVQGGQALGVLAGESGSALPPDLSRLWIQRRRLLHAVPQLVANVPGHYAGRASSTRDAGPAVPK
jgi:hypothetical protein